MELEQACLACMVSSPRIAPRVAAMLDVADFTTGQHRVIFDTMRLMLDEGQRVDEITLSAELRQHGYGETTEDAAAALYAVAASLASVDQAEEYAVAIREEAIRRRVQAATDAALRARGGVEEVVSALETAVFEARSRLHSTEGVRELSGTSLLSALDGFLSAPQQRDGFPYPFPAMRASYGDYQRGRYTLLGGPSGDGKTTCAFQWVEELCEAGASVCVYELEMTRLQVNTLLVLQGGCITQRQAKGLDPMTEEDAARYEARKRQVAGWKLTVVCGPTTPPQIRAHQTREKFDVIFVDHMHKFPKTSAGEYVDMTRYSNELHRITRDLDCSLVALLQLTKARKDDKGNTRRLEPSLGDLRGSGAMEEDADEAFLIYQERDHREKRTGYAKLKIEKMRDGQPGKWVPLRFYPEVMRFREYDPDHAQGPSVLAKRIQKEATT